MAFILGYHLDSTFDISMNIICISCLGFLFFYDWGTGERLFALGYALTVECTLISNIDYSVNHICRLWINTLDGSCVSPLDLMMSNRGFPV